MKTADWNAKTFNLGNAYVLAECASSVYDEDKEKSKQMLKDKFGMKWV